MSQNNELKKKVIIEFARKSVLGRFIYKQSKISAELKKKCIIELARKSVLEYIHGKGIHKQSEISDEAQCDKYTKPADPPEGPSTSKS